jgi:acyl-coenzyme A synthetase/AMP-(fatty) acid ligase
MPQTDCARKSTAEAILAILYTSGTTGEAKGVMLTHTNVLSNVYCLNYWMRYRQGGVYLHAASIFHGADFPAMINMLTDFADATRFDLSSLEVLAYDGSPMPVELYRRTRRMLPGVKLVQVYGMTETGFLTGLEAKEDTIGQLLTSCGRS